MESINNKIYPIAIDIEISNVCNSKCNFCTHPGLVFSEKFMTIDTFRKVCDILYREFGDKEGKPFGMTGLGESFLNPDVAEIFICARKRFPLSNLSANTNGIFFPESIYYDISTSLNNIVFSLRFTTQKKYLDSCGVDKFDIVIENIKKFANFNKNRCKIFVQCFSTENKANMLEIFREELNNNLLKISNEKVIDLVNRDERTGNFYPCYQLWTEFFVGLNMDVFPCCLSVWTPETRKELSIGKLTDDFDLIFEKLNILRNKHDSGEYGICKTCPSILIKKKGKYGALHMEWCRNKKKI